MQRRSVATLITTLSPSRIKPLEAFRYLCPPIAALPSSLRSFFPGANFITIQVPRLSFWLDANTERRECHNDEKTFDLWTPILMNIFDSFTDFSAFNTRLEIHKSDTNIPELEKSVSESFLSNQWLYVDVKDSGINIFSRIQYLTTA